jgi:predicted nucleic acid-binding protein
MIYPDTGCLVKLCYPEPESHLVAARVSGKAICYTLLHELEFTNALHQKAFHGNANSAQVSAAKALVSADLAAGVLIRPTVSWDRAFADATVLAETHTAGIGCRSLDILHCAAARALNASDFITTDGKQKRLALAMGLPFTEL